MSNKQDKQQNQEFSGNMGGSPGHEQNQCDHAAQGAANGGYGIPNPSQQPPGAPPPYGYAPQQPPYPPGAHQNQQPGYPPPGQMPYDARQEHYMGGAGYTHGQHGGNMSGWNHQGQGAHDHNMYARPAQDGRYYNPNPYMGNPAYPPREYYNNQPADSGLSSFFNFRDERFLKGALVGAAATFLLTNDSVQKNAIQSIVKVWNLFQGGLEEVKERFRDAEAEIKVEDSHK